MLRSIVGLSSGFIFTISFVAKGTRPSDFVTHLRGVGMIPARLAWVAGLSVILAEGVVAGLLIRAPQGLAGLVGASCLYAAFAAWVALAVRSGRSGAPCGCLGRLAQLRLGWSSVTLNAILASTCLAVAVVTAPVAVAGAPNWIVLLELSVLVALAYWFLLYALSVSQSLTSSLTRPEATL